MVLMVALSNTLMAQSTPSCTSEGQDADGDGFGWVVNPPLGEQPHSCIVDESTTPTPTIINRQTNAPIQLIRPYWDANTDLANKTLFCEAYSWSDSDQLYKLEETYQRYHHPLPNEQPWIYAWDKTNITRVGSTDIKTDRLLWTVVDGVLNDNVYFYDNSPDQYWVELISLNGGIENATRWWLDDTNYYQCSDPATNSFVPTGAPGVISTAPSGVSTAPAIFTTLEEPRESDLGPHYYFNGPRAVLTRGGSWDIQDLAYKTIGCRSYWKRYFDEESRPGEFIWKFEDYSAHRLMFLPPTAGSPNTGFMARSYLHYGSPRPYVSRWTINEDGTISVPLDFGNEAWFALASTSDGHNVLHYFFGDTLTTCDMGAVLVTAYQTRPPTDEDHKALLIRTNVDTSHCTSLEDTYELRINGDRSCVAEEDPSITNTPDESGSESTITGTTPPDNNSDPNSMQAGVDDGEAQAVNTQASEVTSANETSGGGLMDLWLLYLFVPLLAYNSQRLKRNIG